MIELQIHSRLQPGLVVLVDDDDLDLVAGHTWCISAGGYVLARVDGHLTYLHRLILPGAALVDHANGDKLDCRRANLRPATPGQNQANSRKRPGTTSQYKGVYWYRATGKWQAQIQADGVKRYLGYFAEEADAAAAYDEAAVELFGQFARLNLVPA